MFLAADYYFGGLALMWMLKATLLDTLPSLVQQIHISEKNPQHTVC